MCWIYIVRFYIILHSYGADKVCLHFRAEASPLFPVWPCWGPWRTVEGKIVRATARRHACRARPRRRHAAHHADPRQYSSLPRLWGFDPSTRTGQPQDRGTYMTLYRRRGTPPPRGVWMPSPHVPRRPPPCPATGDPPPLHVAASCTPASWVGFSAGGIKVSIPAT